MLDYNWRLVIMFVVTTLGATYAFVESIIRPPKVTNIFSGGPRDLSTLIYLLLLRKILEYSLNNSLIAFLFICPIMFGGRYILFRTWADKKPTTQKEV